MGSVRKSHRCELEKVSEKSIEGANDIEHVDANKANPNKSVNSLEEHQAEAITVGYPRLERDWYENSINSFDHGGMLSCFIY